MGNGLNVVGVLVNKSIVVITWAYELFRLLGAFWREVYNGLYFADKFNGHVRCLESLKQVEKLQ